MSQFLVLGQPLLSIFSFFISSTIPKSIAHDIVITNGIYLIYMMSTVRVMSPCFINMLTGKSLHVFSITFDGFVLVVFSFEDPKFGPRMSIACIMSAFVIRQLGSILFSIYLTYSLALGHPIMSCIPIPVRVYH